MFTNNIGQMWSGMGDNGKSKYRILGILFLGLTLSRGISGEP